MPVLSKKSAAMPASPIRKLVPYAEKAKKAGRTVYHLNIGQPDIETPEVALQAIRNLKERVIEYSHSAGFESYRKGLATYYASFDIQLDYQDIMITTGGSEALIIAMMTACNPGDEIIIPEPFYANYNGFAVQAGLKVVPVPSSIETGFALPVVSEFEKLITPATRAILICNPGNPTGYLYKKEEIEALAALVKKHDFFLFADEVYREFCYDGAVPYSTLQLSGLDENIVLVDSVSKRYSMCGARVGALISRNKEFMAAALKFGQARLSPPTFGQIASEAALNTPASYFEAVKKEYTLRRNTLVDGLNSIDGVFCPKPGGAFYAIAELPVQDADHFCQWLLESFEHENQTVMMAPASGFYASPGAGKNQVRLAYVLNVDALQKAVACLRVALEQYPGRVDAGVKRVLQAGS